MPKYFSGVQQALVLLIAKAVFTAHRTIVSAALMHLPLLFCSRLPLSRKLRDTVTVDNAEDIKNVLKNSSLPSPHRKTTEHGNPELNEPPRAILSEKTSRNVQQGTRYMAPSACGAGLGDIKKDTRGQGSVLHRKSMSAPSGSIRSSNIMVQWWCSV